MTGGTVVVLGAAGRNFAAGMSGGIAYVFDPDGTFQQCLNPSMVTIDPVLAEADQEAKLLPHLWHLGRSDEALLRSLIENHAKLTGSQRAMQILRSWNEMREKFIKVFPNEYRRALTELADTRRKLAA
jgi:glutamate synthase domain-containing protein 3